MKNLIHLLYTKSRRGGGAGTVNVVYIVFEQTQTIFYGLTSLKIELREKRQKDFTE